LTSKLQFLLPSEEVFSHLNQGFQQRERASPIVCRTQRVTQENASKDVEALDADAEKHLSLKKALVEIMPPSKGGAGTQKRGVMFADVAFRNDT
jgi:hypothetical protein